VYASIARQFVSAAIAPDDASARAPPPGSCARRRSSDNAARTDASFAAAAAVGRIKVGERRALHRGEARADDPAPGQRLTERADRGVQVSLRRV
jgi:hypothetical protein